MNKQILEVVSAVSIEKDVDKEIIFEALEEAISSATKKLIGEMSLVCKDNKILEIMRRLENGISLMKTSLKMKVFRF